MKNHIRQGAGYILHILTFVAYFFFLFVLDIPGKLYFLQYFGMFFFVLGIVLLILSLRSLIKNKSGELIKKGVYAIVRHPMYLGGMFLFIAMICFLPHWIMILLVSINLVVIYRFMCDGDRQNIDRFGDDYVQYIKQVPRLNLITGIANRLREKRITKK